MGAARNLALSLDEPEVHFPAPMGVSALELQQENHPLWIRQTIYINVLKFDKIWGCKSYKHHKQHGDVTCLFLGLYDK